MLKVFPSQSRPSVQRRYWRSVASRRPSKARKADRPLQRQVGQHHQDHFFISSSTSTHVRDSVSDDIEACSSPHKVQRVHRGAQISSEFLVVAVRGGLFKFAQDEL